MFDARARAATAPIWDAGARVAARLGLSADAVTATGFAIGIGACVAAATRAWWLALGLWLANRALDGIDGALARMQGPSDRGGYLDILADFSIYGGFVAGVAVGVPEARLACAVLLLTYYVSGAAFLALSSLLERRDRSIGDERSLRFVGGLAEGTETIVVHSLFCIVPAAIAPIAWAWAGVVAITAVQRAVLGARALAD